jgi:hypothetical protein
MSIATSAFPGLKSANTVTTALQLTKVSTSMLKKSDPKKCTALPLITQKWLNQIKPNSEQLHLIPGIGQGWLEKLQLPE